VTASEYAAAREGAAVASLPGRGLLAVTGPTRVKFLQGLLSNDLASRRPGQGVAAALMDVKGRLLALLRVLATDEAVLLEMPSSCLDVVERLLVHYRVAAPVRFARKPLAAVGLLGPAAKDTLARAGVEVAASAAVEDHVMGAMGGVEVRVVRAGDLPADGWIIHAIDDAAAATVREVLVAAGAAPLSGSSVLDTLRVEDGRPWYGIDITEENLLHETGLVAEYHSPSKGCYVGQEVVARLEARGAKVNKSLRGLALESPVAAGAAITVDDREVGRVTTAGMSPRRGPIAMGFVHRSAAEPGTAIRAGSSPGTVERLPLAPRAT